MSGAFATVGLLARSLALEPFQPLSTEARLAQLPMTLPTRAPVTIHWDAHQIPFIEAAHDDDVAVALGAVHAHLRLAQMEMLRRLARGRVAELLGPLAVGLDRAIRTMEFGRAVPAIVEGLAPATRTWAEGFVAGVNRVADMAPLPPEFGLLRHRPEPWTFADLFLTARLAAADVNWLVWPRLLKVRRQLPPNEWRALWTRLLDADLDPADTSASTLARVTRTGSNAAAVAGRRSASGAALLAADPHLSVALPNVWLAAAFRSPGLNAAGLMPAGFPLIAIGRNAHLAWCGTSLHAAASDLFDASGLDLSHREETIRVRGGGVRRVTLRRSALGPIVSDGQFFRNPVPLALRWIGHEPSDELGAMLGVLRARDAEEFRAALGDFAVPGQTMVHAGTDGRVGTMLAARVPRRTAPPADLVRAPETAASWETTAGTRDFAPVLDPPEGFVASANDRPPPTDVPVGFLFSRPLRVQRMRELLGGARQVTLDDMNALQRDVAAPGALALRDALIARIPPDAAPVMRVVTAWDGRYDRPSQGALAFTALFASLARRLADKRCGGALGAVWSGRALLAREVVAAPDDAFRRALGPSLQASARALRRFGTWGGAHRMELRHPFAAIPFAGRRFAFGAFAAEGGNDTLNKTGHSLTTGRHAVEYGASARFLADLADPDRSRVVLLGGQDGWLGSANFLDQVPLWREGANIELPLRPETARRWPHHTVHAPDQR